MYKRLLFTVVGAGIGATLGLLVDFLGAGHWAVPAGSLAGALAPLLLGPPGK
jgi:hypothetical protein